MVSATDIPSLDDGSERAKNTIETVLVEFINFSVTSQFHCTQASTTVLSQDQDNPRLEGATPSLIKYALKFGA